MRNRFPLALLALSLLVLASCATGITRTDLLRKIQNKSPVLIVDVRSQGEYDRDRLPTAVHIPFYAISSGIQATGYAGNEPIVLYCEHGPRAGLASLALHLHGYDRLFSLEGHMKGWRESGFPVETGREQGTSVTGPLQETAPPR